MRRILVALGTVIALGLPSGISSADPVADPTGFLASENVKVHTILPEQTAIGARFRGNLMYLTTLTGLSIYDVGVPSSPVEIGSLPLPHFENEDVDLGGDILLISNDAAESRGILHVIDISDPTAPALLSQHDMGGDPTGLTGGAPGHTASCILDCAFAWVTDSGGMRVIDLRDPAAPRNLGTFQTPAAGDLGITHDVQTDGNGVAWISGYGGVFGYRIPGDYASRVTAAGEGITDLHASLLYAGTGTAGHSTYGDFESPEGLGLGPGATANDFILHNSRRLKGSDVVYVTEEDYSRPGCRGAGSFETWRLPLHPTTGRPTGEEMSPIDTWETELLAGTAQPAAMCSAHYFDVLGNVVAQAWYEQGLRLLDVSDPANIRQIGFFVPPNGESWAAYFPPTDPRGRIVYLLDASLGLVVLELDRPTSGPLAISQGGAPGEPVVSDPGEPKRKSCKHRKKGKPRRKCRKNRRQQEAAAGRALAPTVRAPVRAEWTSGTPKGAPSATFGYACRIAL